MTTPFSEQTILVTGATNGIGKETARGLARMGAQVVIIGRDATKTEAVLQELRSSTGNPRIHALLADLSLQQEVRRVAEEFLSQYSRLDVLINNAGTVYQKRVITSEGFEATWALNHLSYFLLTHLLLERIRQSTPARIVNVSSSAHAFGKIAFDDLLAEKRYAGFDRYGMSKLGNVLFTTELAARLEGSGITVNAVHPGFVPVTFQNKATVGFRLFLMMTKPFAKTPEQGAATSIYAATATELATVTGKYFANSREKTVAKRAQDQELARRVWELSLHQTGLTSSI
jgi:NAD(P)-dependent dehydrogenase (short-subunit alcohol dehydrogenase family)